MNPTSVKLASAPICLATAVFALFTGVSGARAADSAAAIANPAQNLDAICKSAPMAAGYVPVGEIDSPECAPEAPPRKNAWLIDKVRDKIVSCVRPDYEKDYAPAIGYLVCKRISTSACPLNLDGTPNGFELTKGPSCNGPNMTTGRCFTNDKESQPSTFGETTLNWSVEVKRAAEGCKGHAWGPDNYIAYDLDRENVAPFCIARNIVRLRENQSANFFKLKYNWFAYGPYVRDHNHFDAIIRVYHDDSCPDYPHMGQLNAMVIKRHPLMDRGNQIFMCDLTFKIVLPDGEVDNFIEYLEQQKEFERFLPLKKFHDDRCGLGTSNNALQLTLPDRIRP